MGQSNLWQCLRLDALSQPCAGVQMGLTSTQEHWTTRFTYVPLLHVPPCSLIDTIFPRFSTCGRMPKCSLLVDTPTRPPLSHSLRMDLTSSPHHFLRKQSSMTCVRSRRRLHAFTVSSWVHPPVLRTRFSVARGAKTTAGDVSVSEGLIGRCVFGTLTRARCCTRCVFATGLPSSSSQISY